MSNEPALYVGLMSGTSVDAIDSALVSFASDGLELLHTHEHPIDPELRAEIADISHPGESEIERLGRLDRELGVLFATATNALLAEAGIRSDRVTAIGSHGQTVRHLPPAADDDGFTLQIGDPNTIAELTRITTVADFRRRDMACGGQGAPLAPAFHAAVFAAPGVDRAIVNIGGIANATLLHGEQLTGGFDTGPGNTLLDLWHARHRGANFDRDGCWAAGGQASQALLEDLLSDTYFELQGPRSTGKEHFNLAWLEPHLGRHSGLDAADVQATLAQLTAQSIANALAQSGLQVQEVYICGGGAHNAHLLECVDTALVGARTDTTAALGLDPDWVEASAFAWLAHRRMQGLHGNSPMVTGAGGERILGGVYLP